VEVIKHICVVFGYDLLCDLLEMLNLIVDPIQRTNMRGLMAERFRALDLCTEGYRFDSRWILFSFNFFPFIFNFYVYWYFSILSPFLQLIFFKFQNSSVFSPCNVTKSKCIMLCTLAGT
jgi:hypothetical protein